MKLALFIIVAAVLVFGGLAYMGKASAMSNFSEGCEQAGAPPEICSCVTDKMSAEVSVISFVGVGDFRPLLPSDAEIQQIGVEAGAACALEISTQ